MRRNRNYRTWKICELHHTQCCVLTVLIVFAGESYALWSRRRALLDLRSVHSYPCRYSWFDLRQDLQHPTSRDPSRKSGREAERCIRPDHLGVAHTIHILTNLRTYDPDASHTLPDSTAR